MAKEKFVRSKPHVNIGSFLKKKLGFGAGEPPVEPLEPEGTTGDSGGWANVEGLGSTVDNVEHREGGEAPQARQQFNPAEFPIKKTVDWQDNEESGDDAGRVKVQFPWEPAAEGGANQLTLDDTAGAEQMNKEEVARFEAELYSESGQEPQASPAGRATDQPDLDDEDPSQEAPPVPTPYPNVATEPGAGHAEDSGAQHEYVVQRNESDLESQTEPAKGGGDPDQPVIQGQVPGAGAEGGAASEVKEGGLNATTHKFAGPSAGGSSGEGGDADQPVVAGEAESQAAEQWRNNAFEAEIGNMPSVNPEAGDEVLVGFESGDPDQPVVVGSLWNSDDDTPEEDEPSVLQDLEATGEMVPLEGGRMPDVGSVDPEDVDLDPED